MAMKITPEDLENSTELDWTKSKEFWNEYKLNDGTTLKVKLTLRGVKRLNKFTPDGAPMYIINSINVVRAIGIPPLLGKKPKKGDMNPV